jgi:hypothetical protein
VLSTRRFPRNNTILDRADLYRQRPRYAAQSPAIVSTLVVISIPVGVSIPVTLSEPFDTLFDVLWDFRSVLVLEGNPSLTLHLTSWFAV